MLEQQEKYGKQERYGQDENEGEGVVRDSIDNVFFVGRAGGLGNEPEEPYQPVMYKIVKTKE